MADAGRRLAGAFRRLTGSLLWLPLLMTLGAVGLAALTTALDHAGAGQPGGPLAGTLAFGGGPDAATALLTAIAAAFATIAGVVYSVTLVTLQIAATKYSAQVLPAFEKDRYNQGVLGAFTGTFAYALLVLKAVRQHGPEGTGGFVPVLGVNVAIALAVLGLFLFAGLLANLAAYTRPTRFVSDLARRGMASLDEVRRPAGLEGFTPAPWAGAGGAQDGAREPLRAAEEGYVGRVDWARLRGALARAAAAGHAPQALDVRAAPGEWVEEGTLLAVADAPWPPEAAKGAAAAFSSEPAPDPRKDPLAAAGVLGDLAITALSGGSTDTGVAKECVRALLRLATGDLRREPPAAAFDVELPGGERVRLRRAAPVVHERCLAELAHLLAKAAREGHGDVGEVWARHLGPLLEAAAAAEPARWEPAMASVAEAGAGLLGGIEEPGPRARIETHLARALGRLEQAGQGDRAAQLRAALWAAGEEGERRGAAEGAWAR